MTAREIKTKSFMPELNSINSLKQGLNALKDWTALDYAKWLGLKVYESTEEWEDANCPKNCVYHYIQGIYYYILPTGDGSPWSTQGWLGRTVIAAVCWEKMSMEQQIEIVKTVAFSSAALTWADAVLAAVRSVAKCG